MQIRSYEEVDPDEAYRLSTAAFHRAFRPDDIRSLLRGDPRYAYGYGVYAVERGRLVGQAVPMQIPVRLTTGVEAVGAVGGVCALPSMWGRGYARRLMEHVHEMFRADALRIATLTTSRNLRGYGLYARLGYVDLAPFCLGTRILSRRRRPPSGLRIREAKPRDLPRVHALYKQATAGLLGWTERSPRELPNHMATFPRERACYRVATRGPRVVGYFRTRPEDSCLMEEVVAPDDADFRDVVSAIAAGARDPVATVEWITCRRDAARFRARGFRLDRVADTTMAVPLTDAVRAHDLPRLFGGTSGRFVQYPSDDF